MKYIITVEEDNRILAIGNQFDYLDNGYPRIIETNTAYPIDLVNVYEVESIPQYVETEKYCYDLENGFYENPNYEEIEEMI